MSDTRWRIYRQPGGVWIAEHHGVRWFLDSWPDACQFVAERHAWRAREVVAA